MYDQTQITEAKKELIVSESDLYIKNIVKNINKKEKNVPINDLTWVTFIFCTFKSDHLELR